MMSRARRRSLALDGNGATAGAEAMPQPCVLRRPSSLRRPSLAAHRILDAADRVLHLPLDLIGLAFALELAIPGDFAGDLFGLAFCLLRRALDSILVDHDDLQRGPGPNPALSKGSQSLFAAHLPKSCR